MKRKFFEGRKERRKQMFDEKKMIKYFSESWKRGK